MLGRQTTIGVLIASGEALADFSHAARIDSAMTAKRLLGIAFVTAAHMVYGDRFCKNSAADVAIRCAMRYDSAKRQRNTP